MREFFTYSVGYTHNNTTYFKCETWGDAVAFMAHCLRENTPIRSVSRTVRVIKGVTEQ